jgi:hypothetical protein
MASSSKKCSNSNDISSIIESKELVQELKDSDESEMSDTHESSESDFHNNEHDMLLPDSGDPPRLNHSNYTW